jgi:hypothetical protein
MKYNQLDGNSNPGTTRQSIRKFIQQEEENKKGQAPIQA